MKYYDLSRDLNKNTTPWPGDFPFNIEERQTSAIVSKLTISTHLGTHIDAPKHFIFDAIGVDKIKPEQLIGKFKVFEVKSKNLISPDDIKKLKISKGDKILFKTNNSKRKLLQKPEFTEDYVSLSLEAAKILSSKNIALVGIDYFGIEAKSAPGHPVHIELMKKKIVIVEGLDMTKTPTGTYNGSILPLKITDADGSPARAILWK